MTKDWHLNYTGFQLTGLKKIKGEGTWIQTLSVKLGPDTEDNINESVVVREQDSLEDYLAALKTVADSVILKARARLDK